MTTNVGIEYLLQSFTHEELAMQVLALTHENQELIKLLSQKEGK